MAIEKRRGKARKVQGESEKPTKTEYAVAKFLRFNVPVKEGKLVNMTVQYFIATKAVDALMESKWSILKTQSDPLFTNRASCVDYCNILLQKGLFHRAAKIEKKKDRDRKKKKGDGDNEDKIKESKQKKEKKKKGKEDVDKDIDDDKHSEEKAKDEEKDEKKEEKKDEKKDEEKKRKKKMKLEMHHEQLFKDGEEVYVWIYDPVPFKTFIIGLLLVLGAVGVCLFPLWPPEVRLGVYYLSLSAAGFVGFILSLWVVRLILFCTVWTFSFGKHHFWFLPNLTEDVSFFDSFKPLYKHDAFTTSPPDDTKTNQNKPAAEEAKDSDNSKSESLPSEQVLAEDGGDADEEREESEEGTVSDRDLDLDTNQDNGYEIVDRDDLEKDTGSGEDSTEDKKTR